MRRGNGVDFGRLPPPVTEKLSSSRALPKRVTELRPDLAAEAGAGTQRPGLPDRAVKTRDAMPEPLRERYEEAFRMVERVARGAVRDAAWGEQVDRDFVADVAGAIVTGTHLDTLKGIFERSESPEGDGA
jgi:hypothetical protein